MWKGFLQMQNEKELFDLIKDTYPQNPRKEFIVTVENKLRQQARSMNKKGTIKRFSLISSSILLFTLAFTWIFFFYGKEIINDVNNVKDQTVFSTIENEDPLVLIYHTHNYESFIPETKNPYSESTNITLVGRALSNALKGNNINTVFDDTDVMGILKERNLRFTDSYAVTREILTNLLNEHDTVKMVFDIHRGSLEQADRTVNIDGVDYAKVLFVVSKTTDNYKENREFANLLHEKLVELYPQLSKGVFEKGVDPRNTYNQDLHINSTLVEIGGTENTLEESYRTADILAKVIKEIIENKEE